MSNNKDKLVCKIAREDTLGVEECKLDCFINCEIPKIEVSHNLRGSLVKHKVIKNTLMYVAWVCEESDIFDVEIESEDVSLKEQGRSLFEEVFNSRNINVRIV